MNEELDILLQILEEQRGCQSALVSLSERKLKAIAVGDTQDLGEIVELEHGVLRETKAVEKKRAACAGRLAKLMGLPEDSVRMSVLLEHADGPRKAALVKIRDDLNSLVDQQASLNDLNMKLLNMNMDYVQFLLNATSTRKPTAVYGRAGGVRASEPAPSRLLDRTV